MKRKRFSEEQTVGILNEMAAGATVEVCRRHGISKTTSTAGRPSSVAWR